MGKLDGRVAIVTGGAKGMGYGSAKVMAGHGAKVVIVGKSENVHGAAANLRKEGYEVIAYQADVRELTTLIDIFKKIVEKYGKIDILVNCAGVGVTGMGAFVDDDAEAGRDLTMNINFNGTWNACKAAIPYMIEAKYGRIVTFGSVTGCRVTDPGMIAYSASKGAIEAFTKGLAMEYAHIHITANCILPGVIDTQLIDDMIKGGYANVDVQEIKDAMASNIPMRRLGTVEEAGELVSFLSSNESSYITGASIVFDGGSIVPETPPIYWKSEYGNEGQFVHSNQL